MKRRLQKRYLVLIICYSVVLIFIPYMLDYSSKTRQLKSALHRQRCPDLVGSFGLWNMLEGKGVNESEFPESSGNRSSSSGKTHIYLHATWRTGSSFLGELFNQHPDVFYLYEPMWHMWQALYPGDAESLQGALRDMMSSLFRCDFSVLRLYSSNKNLTASGLFGWKNNKVICSEPLCSAYQRGAIGLIDGTLCERCKGTELQRLEQECKKYPVVVIKDVRVLDLGVLTPLMRDPELNLQVIQIFRDPRAVHNSRLKSKQALVRESIQVLRSRKRADKRLLVPSRSQRAESYVSSAMEVICDSWLGDILLVRSAPDWVRKNYLSLRYEDMVLYPVRELHRLYHFSGLRNVPAMEDFVLNMTRGEGYSSEKPFMISSRDAREAIYAWRERLSTEQVNQVEAYCHEVMRLLAYQQMNGDKT
ncbi:carbohydrate sulfotransferase 7 [Polypterus senegalus]